MVWNLIYLEEGAMYPLIKRASLFSHIWPHDSLPSCFHFQKVILDLLAKYEKLLKNSIIVLKPPFVQLKNKLKINQLMNPLFLFVWTTSNRLFAGGLFLSTH